VADSDEPRDAGALSEAYERLREMVLAGGAGGWRLGHGVLSSRGMTGWMSTVGALVPPASGDTGDADVPFRFSSAGCEPASAEKRAPLPGVDQVVAVLTQMVLPLAA
jgi:hypothetical protein